jgi:hypothetical protein
LVVAALLVAGCTGYTTEATNISKQSDGSYSAQLNFVVSCGSGESCSWYVHYRLVGASNWTNVPSTPHGPVAGPISNVSLSEKVTGLTAGAQYEYQVCGNWQPGQQFICVGPDDRTNTTTKFTAAAWSLQGTPSPSSATSSDLSGVSCTSTTACTAVGYYINSADASVALTERWDGKSWTIQTTPAPSNSLASILSGVSCTSASACTAVGSNDDSAAFSYVLLAEGWNGSAWTIQSTPTPSTGALNGVSCTSATACTATVLGFNEALAERWDGASWTMQTVSIASQAALNGVSCTSSTACIAVGPGINEALAGAWNGRTWTIQTTANLGSNQSLIQVTLNDVSCTSATACTAIGSDDNSTGDQVPLAERWDGTTWTIETTPTPIGARSTDLGGVSCTSATACTAVGSYYSTVSTTVALTERWDGSTWTIQTTPTPSGATSSSLSRVSCTSATACTAVGSYTNSAGTRVALAERYSG